MARERLVLLPGMMCDARLFAPQAAAFGARCEVRVCDLTGGATIAALADSVFAQAGPGPFSLAGLSLGGIVAMAAAGRRPERVRRLALLDTSHLPDTAARRRARAAQLRRVRQGKLREVVVGEMKPHYLAARNRRRQPLRDLLVAMALDLGPQAFVDQTRALAGRRDQTPALRAYGGPALVLCGREDALCPPERHRSMARLLAGAELELVPGAGHITTLEAPGAVNRALERWLARPPAAS